jgi:hypothetical protein
VELAGLAGRPQDRWVESGLNAMRSIVFPVMLSSFAALTLACGGELVCTQEQRVAVRVHVSSPRDQDLPVVRVTADNGREDVCESSSEADASSAGTYRCNEQGGGEYTIRVYSDALTWTTRVDVDANECHTTEIKDVDVVLDPQTADDA